MPNLKLYVDGDRYPDLRPSLTDLLPAVRTLLCDMLDVEESACQLAVIPVLAPPGQPAISAELAVLPKPQRTRTRIEALACRLRDRLVCAEGIAVAVRISTLDAETYVSVRS